MVSNRSRTIGVSVAVTIGLGLVSLCVPAPGNSADHPPAVQATSHARGLREGETTVVTSSEATSLSPPAAPSQAETEESGCKYLAQDHPLRTKLNGERLPLDYWNLEKGEERNLLVAAKVVPLSDGRLLCGLGDTLCMLNSNRQLEWKYVPSFLVMDFAVVESTGLVYGTAGDNVMFILDVATGRPLYTDSLNGQRAYAKVVPFGKDECLITGSLVGYREALQEWSFGKAEMVETDWITAWRGTEALWSAAFPPDADLVVNGDRIFAVTKTDKSIYARQIIPPNSDSSH
jgi:hypothetical protein